MKSLFSIWTAFAAVALFAILKSYMSRRLSLKAKRVYFQGKVIWITGASSGIGESLAYELVEYGAQVIISARRTDELERVKSNALNRLQSISSSDNVIKSQIAVPFIQPLDLLDNNSIDAALKSVLSKFEKVDILINNSGISSRSSVEESSEEMEKRVMQVNFFGAVRLSKGVLPGMRTAQQGTIALISSVQGKIGMGNRSIYAASKHALHGYFDSLRAEESSRGIQVVSICPGYVKTNLSLNALTGSGSSHGIMDEATAKGYSPEYVASQTLSAIVNRDPEIILATVDAKLAVFLRNVIPTLLFKILAKRAAKQRSSQ